MLWLACLFVSGCAAPFLEYDDQTLQARIDNPDRDDVWDRTDENGNSMIDGNESYRPTLEFKPLYEPVTTTPSPSSPPPPPLHVPVLLETDFGNASFDAVSDNHVTKDRIEVRGMQLSRSIHFTNHDWEGGIEHDLELLAGARIFELKNQFTFASLNQFAEADTVRTRVDNAYLGPQIGAKWNSRKEKWSVGASGMILAGQLDLDGEQSSQFSNGSDPNDSNRSLLYRTYTEDKEQMPEFSPIGEFDASTSYQATKQLTFRLGYSVFYIRNLWYAAESLSWVPDDTGILDAPGRDEFQKTVYANIELLR